MTWDYFSSDLQSGWLDNSDHKLLEDLHITNALYSNGPIRAKDWDVLVDLFIEATKQAQLSVQLEPD